VARIGPDGNPRKTDRQENQFHATHPRLGNPFPIAPESDTMTQTPTIQTYSEIELMF
jgi:hypothetical protein